MVALGSRAGTTSRGNSLNSLIKSGKRMAEVAVMLRNSGTDAYHPDVYGDSIIIKRKLTVEGASTYRVDTNSIYNVGEMIVDWQKATLNSQCREVV